MFLHRRFVPGLAAASFIVGDEKAKVAAVIDPLRDVEEYVNVARQHKLAITHILETHVHADFASGARELKAALGGAPKIVSSAMGGPEWTPAYADTKARDGEELALGSLKLKAFHTPGHTPEHITWALYDTTRSSDEPWLLFTGDFLFVGSIGRPDLLGKVQQQKLAHELYETVFGRASKLPDFAEVYPSHGAGSLCGKAIGSRDSSTLGYERRFNESLQRKPEPQWIEALMKEMPAAPPYFLRMKRINVEGPPVLGERDKWPGRAALSPKQVRELMVREDMLVLDTRAKEAFAAAHIPASINIPLDNNLPTWAGWVLPYDKRLVLAMSDPAELEAVITHLIRVGFDRIEGWLEGGIRAWASAGLPTDSFEMIDAPALAERLKRDSRPLVLDVRTDSEWDAGHIEGARHVHAGQVEQHLEEIPRDRPVAVICGSGHRASIAASLLKRHGYQDVANVAGGMTAWKAAEGTRPTKLVRGR